MKCISDHAGCKGQAKSRAGSAQAAWEDPHKWHFLAALWKHSWNVNSYQPQLHISIKSNKQDKEQRTSIYKHFSMTPINWRMCSNFEVNVQLTCYTDSLITASLRGSDPIQLNKKIHSEFQKLKPKPWAVIMTVTVTHINSGPRVTSYILICSLG